MHAGFCEGGNDRADIFSDRIEISVLRIHWKETATVDCVIGFENIRTSGSRVIDIGRQDDIHTHWNRIGCRQNGACHWPLLVESYENVSAVWIIHAGIMD